MMAVIVFIDRLKMVIRSGDVPCGSEVMVFACRMGARSGLGGS